MRSKTYSRRQVLGAAAALGAGAFFLGAFLGAAISQLGVGGDGAEQALLRALAATVGAALAVVAGLLLEHACRVPPAGD